MGIQSINCISNCNKKTTSYFSFHNMINIVQTQTLSQYYNLLEQIGSGSYSVAYKATCRRTGNLRAIKVVSKKHPKCTEIALNQFNALKQLEHPNIVKLYQLLQDKQSYNIVTQLCSGRQLFDLIISRKTFNQLQIFQLFYKIAHTLSYIHNSHIMHRDLKPQNIIYFQQNKSVKIIDFGSAITYNNSQPIQRDKIGTSYYVAPEVLKKYYNEKCDVWSLGIILYIMLSGQPPFKGKTPSVILQNVQKGQLHFNKPIWRRISGEAQELIRSMLNRDYCGRLSIREVLEHPWIIELKEKLVKNVKEWDVRLLMQRIERNMSIFKVQVERYRYQVNNEE